MKLELLKQKLDYGSIIKGKHLDLATYKKKFEMWDYVMANGLENTSEAVYLLNDLTIFAYAFLKDDEQKPFRMTAYQDAIAGCRHDFSEVGPERFILFKASNQIGKSRMLTSSAIQKAFSEENVNVVMVSKSLPQSQFLLASIRHSLNNSAFAETWRESLGETANTTVLTFQRDNGRVLNRIICAPCGEGLLGYPVHYLYLDEADFYEDGKTFFWKVALPRTNKTKGQIILFSNPNPDIARTSSILWELWNGELFKRKFTFNFLDAHWNSVKEFEEIKRNSPSHIFISTHMGDFPVEAGSFFSYKEIQDMLQRDWQNTGMPSLDSKTAYIGVDIGKMNDNTVICVGYTKKPLNSLDKYDDLFVKSVEVLPLKTDYDVIVNRLLELKNHYSSQNMRVVVGYDATGQKTFGDLCKRMGLSVFPVDFSRKETNKTLLYNDFKLMAENRKIKVVYSPETEKQLSDLVFKTTETKKYKKVEAKGQTDHDDIPDGLAVLIHISVNPSRIPVSVVSVSSKVKEEEMPVQEVDCRKIVERESILRNSPRSYGKIDEQMRGIGRW